MSLSSISLVDIGLIFQLVLLEGLLSFDNALALAALVNKKLKSEAERRRALVYGIWGAYVMRIAIIFVGVSLMRYEWVKVCAGFYLVFLAIQHLFFGEDPVAEEAALEDKVTPKFKMSAFWSTVISVELMDLMFSIDSIGVALAISDKQWILISGAVIGIIMMRFSAQIFIKLIDKLPLLETAAFILVGIAGMNVLLKTKDLPLGFTTLTIDMGLHENALLAVLLTVLIGSVVLNLLWPKKFAKVKVE